ncbi:lactonase family protein [Ancylomarina sp. 16SWW S1-10-2]|uniref:lactonase family protein n=1 Tax=Ancylomarina sp. 16SWW S1-10-2 TaxID=2499681 RepID=UPI0012AD647E|nr:lactonase family protein [Ancylomarina sp. 16SWW S1-10-2]MRT92724.1 lactonase family protein [Ancylomarina sp. 16SWW S1-10-2]
MQYQIICIILVLLTGCKTNNKEMKQDSNNYSFYVGTYTDKESEGIYKYVLQKDGHIKPIGLVAKSENPSFLAMSDNKQYLLAVNEISNDDEVGTIESFSILNDSLSFKSKSTTGGAHPCFVNINAEGYVLTANYTGGNIGLLKLDKKGELSDLLDIQQHSGKGIGDRQQEPHAHSVWFESSNNDVISIDLGTNELWFSQLDTNLNKFQAKDPYKLKMDDGAGPRHLAFHPNNKWIYVINELNSTISLILKADNNQYKMGLSYSTLPKTYTEANAPADIHISSDGNFLYASNRGHNSLVIYKINKNDGSLNLLDHVSTHGKWPRNFSLSPDENYLLVANRHTNNIVSFKRDKKTGLLEYVDQIEAYSPVCILF